MSKKLKHSNLSEKLAENKDFIRGEKPKVLYLDLEISPALIYAYGAYEVNALKVKQPPMIVSYAWQWEGEKTIHCKILPDYPQYKSGILNLTDKYICRDLYDLMNEADILVGHNFQKFDLKQAKARFFLNGFPPTKKWVVEDTLVIARRYFGFIKNNLDYLSEESGDVGKTKVKHSDVIWGCLDGDMKDWEDLRTYNKRDIVITRNRYKDLGPWHETGFNKNLIYRRDNACPHCLATKSKKDGLNKKGKVYWRQVYRCLSCWRRWSGEKIEKEVERVNQTNL